MAKDDADVDFRQHWEFTVLRRVGDRWQPVGTVGDLPHVKDEMAAWRRDEPEDVFVYGQREVGPWTFGDERNFGRSADTLGLAGLVVGP